jgi:hypothetical protein
MCRCPECGQVGWPGEFSQKWMGTRRDQRCLSCAGKPTLALPWRASTTGGAS